MDVVALFQYGVTQAVATLGTATTPDHAELLFRNAPDVVFCFDGDKAGRSAAWRALESVLPRMRDGRQAFFLFLPEGEDPDSIVRKDGAVGFEARLHHATPLSEFLFAELGKDVNLSTLDGRARLAERARPLLAQIPDGAFRDLMHVHLTEITGANVAVRKMTKDDVRGPSNEPQKQSLVRKAITALLQDPSLALDAHWPPLFSTLNQPGIDLLVELIALIRDRPQITTGALLEEMASRPEGAALKKLALQTLPADIVQRQGAESWRKEWRGALQQLDIQTLEQRTNELRQKSTESGLSDSEKQELLALLDLKSKR